MRFGTSGGENLPGSGSSSHNQHTPDRPQHPLTPPPGSMTNRSYRQWFAIVSRGPNSSRYYPRLAPHCVQSTPSPTRHFRGGCIGRCQAFQGTNLPRACPIPSLPTRRPRHRSGRPIQPRICPVPSTLGNSTGTISPSSPSLSGFCFSLVCHADLGCAQVVRRQSPPGRNSRALQCGRCPAAPQ